MARAKLILIGFHSDVLDSISRGRLPDCDIVRVETGSEAIDHLGRSGAAVAVAAESLSDMSGAAALALIEQQSPSTRRILSAADASRQSSNSLEDDVVHVIVPAGNENLLATVVREALERCDLETLHRDVNEKLRLTQVELDSLTARLEEEVTDRTGQLAFKIKELEGRNRIARHLMRIHSMDETLEEVLRVLSEILRVDRAVVHLSEGEGHTFIPKAEIRVREGDHIPEVYYPGESGETAPIVKRALEQARDSRTPQNVTDPQTPFVSPFAVVPILRDEDLLGLIEVENYRSGRQITDQELETLTSLAVEVAVAIQDVRYHESFEKWKHQLERILTEVVHIDSQGSD